jgi:penicillin-binding protein 1A
MNKDKKTSFLGYIWRPFKVAGSWYIGLFRGRPWWVKLLSTIATLVVLFFLYLGAVDNNVLWLFGKSPSMSTIKNKRPAQASEIYSADGKQIGKFFSENRTPVTYDEVAPVFWQALISTEDERFYSHHGIDYQAFGAALKDYVLHHDARGASTITQQLAKNLFRVRTEYSTGLLGNIPGVKMLIMKSKEWITAYKLEYHFSKQEILTQYANTVDFGSNAFGIKTAAKTYFGKKPSELKTEEAAILVGMLKATTYYNPRLHPDNALKRRNVVLDNMRRQGHLSQEACDSLKALDIDLDFSVENAYDGEANYFREAVGDWMKQWCREYYGEDGAYAYYTEGLKIYTTLDTRMQRYAEEAAVKQMKQVQKNFNSHWGNTNPWQDERHIEIAGFIEDIAKRQPYYKILEKKFGGNEDSINYYMNLPHPVKLFDYEQGTIEREMSTMDSIRYMVRFMHCGFVAMEPQTGHVKAWVGDVSFDSWKYDKVTAQRQPGSTFKLFVYTEAMNQGMTPVDRVRDSYFAMKVYDAKKKKEVTWAPTNANGYFTGDSMPLRVAFAQSINSVAVKLGQRVGIPNIVKTAQAMGIKSPLDPTPALALGSSDVNLLELVNSYSTIIDDGLMHEPVLVERIVDRDGKEIYHAPTQGRQAVPYRSAFFVQQLLKAGLQERGATSMSLWGYVRNFPDTEFGGKTGTSNNHSDAWFVGVSPRLVCGAWVGGEYRSIHFRTGALGQGSRTALPICGYFYESVLSDPAFKHYRTKFAPPRDASIQASEYQGGTYVPSYRDSDSLATDSLATFEIEQQEVELDEEGNSVIGQKSRETDNNSEKTTTDEPNGEATEPKP